MGKELLACEYEKVEPIYGKDQFVVVDSNKQKLVNKQGETVLESGYDTIKQITSQGIVFEKSNKYGAMKTTGEVIIENIYDDLKETEDGIYIAKRGEQYGIINDQNETKVDFIYTKINYNKTADLYTAEDAEFNTSVIGGDGAFEAKVKGILSEVNDEKGYIKIKVNGEYKYYNFKFEEKEAKDLFTTNTLYLSKKEGKYGYVNSKGEVVVDYTYDDGTEQNEAGYVSVKKNGKWGSIDSNGKVVLEPTYNLDNNYLVDFVGKWHLGQDINMNYYCDK